MLMSSSLAGASFEYIDFSKEAEIAALFHETMQIRKQSKSSHNRQHQPASVK